MRRGSQRLRTAALCAVLVGPSIQPVLSAEPMSFTIGDERIEIAMPAGYFDACAAHDELRRLYAVIEAGGQQLHGCLMTPEEVASFDAAGSAETIDTEVIYAIASLKALAGRSMTQPQFEALAMVLLNQFEGLVERGRDRIEAVGKATEAELKAQLGVDVALSEPQLTDLRPLIDRPGVAAFSLLRSFDTLSEGYGRRVDQAVAIVVMHIRGKVVIANIEKTFDGAVRRNDVDEAARAFVKLQGL